MIYTFDNAGGTMDTLGHCQEHDDNKVELTSAGRRKHMEYHGHIVSDADIICTEGMSWVEFYKWLGY